MGDEVSAVSSVVGPTITAVCMVLMIVRMIIRDVAKKKDEPEAKEHPLSRRIPSSASIAAVVRDQAERQQMLEAIQRISEESHVASDTLATLARAEEKQTDILRDIRQTQAAHGGALSDIRETLREVTRPIKVARGAEHHTETHS